MRAAITAVIAIAGYQPVTALLIDTPLVAGLLSLQPPGASGFAATGSSVLWVALILLFAWSLAGLLLNTLEFLLFRAAGFSGDPACQSSEFSNRYPGRSRDNLGFSQTTTTTTTDFGPAGTKAPLTTAGLAMTSPAPKKAPTHE